MKDIKSKILFNQKIASGCFKLIVEAPYIAKTAKPGQFVQIRCSDTLDPLLRRPFSIHRLKASLDLARDRQGSRLPLTLLGTGKGIEILYEIVGKGTRILSEKKTGEFLDVLGPLGNGFVLPSALPVPSKVKGSLQPSAVLIAGGIGIAPLVFLAEELAEKRIKTKVLIGARTKKLILCTKDFKKLGAEVHIATDDGTSGCKGFVSSLLEKQLGTRRDMSQVNVYACGPQPMLKCISYMCNKKDIKCQISLEEKMACGIGACLGCAVKVRGTEHGLRVKLACKDGPVFEANRIEWD